MPGEMERLERDLELLAAAIIYPPSPDLATAVRRRAEGARPRPERPQWALAGVGLAALAVALATLVGTVSPARDAVADFFDRINIFETAEVPAGLPTDIPGTPVTLEQAADRVGRTLVLPRHPGGAALSPAKVLLDEYPQTNLKVAALFFEPEGSVPFVLFETNGGVGKGLVPDAEATPVSGLGREAYWLEGLRIVQMYDPAGDLVREATRATEANTLLWEADGFVYRIEGGLSQDEALRIAQSVR